MSLKPWWSIRPQGLNDNQDYTIPPPMQHWMAGDCKPSLQKQCCTWCTHRLPRAGAGTRHLSQPGSPAPSLALPASPPGTTRQVEAPGSTGWWLLQLLRYLICVFVLSISFSSSFPALPGRPRLQWSVFLLWWRMHTAEARGGVLLWPENALTALSP